jgi:hypothetical protein
MNQGRWLICCAGILLAHTSLAGPLQNLIGTAPPDVTVNVESDLLRTCPDLYREYAALVPASYDYRTDFWTRPENRAAGVVGAVFTPALAYWGYSGLTDYRKANQMAASKERISELEWAFAQKQCFVSR